MVGHGRESWPAKEEEDVAQQSTPIVVSPPAAPLTMSFNKVRQVSANVDHGLSAASGSLATVVTKWPYLTIVVMTILAFGLMPGMIIGPNQRNSEKLWTPQDTQSQDENNWVKSTFGSDERKACAFSTSDRANLLTRDSLVALYNLQAGIMSVTAQCDKGSCKGNTITYQDVKYKGRSSVLSIWGDQVPPASADIIADVNDNTKWKTSSGETLELSDMLGGVIYDASGQISGAEAFITTMWLRNSLENIDDSQKDPASDAWELKFDDYVKDFSSPYLSKNYPLTVNGQDEAKGDAIKGDITILIIGCYLLGGFSVVVMSHHKLVESNGIMAIASLVSCGFSIVSTYGLCGYIGVEQNPVTSVLFLVLLGIGVDDGYVIVGDFMGTTAPSPKERIVRTMAKAGSSIAVTSVTDFVSFFAGASSSLPALRDFCIFAAVGIFFDFLFQSTFFVAILYCRARCSVDNRPDWLCCIRVSPESTGCGVLEAPVCSRNGQHVCCPCTRDRKHGGGEGLVRIALNIITKFTFTPIGSVVVAVITVGMLTGGIVGIPNMQTDFDYNWFVPDDDDYQDTYDIRKKYFPSDGGYPLYVFTKSGVYHTAHSDGSLQALYQRSLSNEWVDRSVSNWYLSFTADAGRDSRSKVSEAAFVTELKAYVDSSAGSRYLTDIIFTTTSSGAATGVVGTRAMYFAVSTANGGEDVKLTKSVRSSVNSYTLSSFVFSTPLLFFDGLDVVAGETIQNVLVACGIVFVMMLLMLADILAAVLVLCMVGLVDVCLLGYMAHWDLAFNSVTAINCVIAVGLAVDYSAHIAHSFLTARGSGVDRAMEAVDHIGMSVFHGAFSTFIAVLPLAMSKSYVFRVLFKMWFMIIIFGTYFGLIVLPLLLRFLGPFIGSHEPTQSEDEKPPKEMPPVVVGSKDVEGGHSDGQAKEIESCSKLRRNSAESRHGSKSALAN